MEDKILGLLGIARRAGHTVIGFDAVKAALLTGKAQLVLLAADCSPKTEKELRFAAAQRPCPLLKLSADKAALSAALGLQKPVAAVATDDRGFAAGMRKHAGIDTKEDVAL
ncbi:MAG: ribosomal L7Ae/L30e/S12e/Gadd45 family protein [Ruminococcaceae bacterium]|nr:ribosomal L7Ae/L30e/S12e/Gadd45 family protein [Oscillospiraceae bacterium]